MQEWFVIEKDGLFFVPAKGAEPARWVSDVESAGRWPSRYAAKTARQNAGLVDVRLVVA